MPSRHDAAAAAIRCFDRRLPRTAVAPYRSPKAARLPPPLLLHAFRHYFDAAMLRHDAALRYVSML